MSYHTSKGVESIDQAAETLESLAAYGLEAAKKLGADGAKIATSASFQKRLVVENKQFTLANSLASRSIGLLVHKDQKKGSASINTVSEESINTAVASALALAKYSVPDETLTLASLSEAPRAKVLPFLYTEELAQVDLEAIQGLMQEVLSRLTSDSRVALDRFEMAVDVSFHALASSTGMRQAERQAMASWSFMGMGRDGEEVTGFDYDSGFALSRGAILAASLKDSDAFVAKLLGLFKPRQCPSYKGAILLTPRAVHELLVDSLLYHAGGRQVMDGKSRWDKAVGQRVVSAQLTLRDHPHDARFSGATSFDGDGVPTKAQTFVDRGVLQMILHDCYSAKRCKAKTTATSGGPFALEVAAGTSSKADLLRSHKQLLVVDRFSGNADPIKGDFSGVAKGSRLFVNGEDAGSVTETMIAGNFFTIAEEILGVSRETEMVSGSFLSPYILVGGVSVTGAL